MCFRLKCYITYSRICIAPPSRTTTSKSRRYISQTPATRGRSSARSSCRTNKATDRPHTPTIRDRKALTVRMRANPPREGMDGVKEEEMRTKDKEKWERVYIQDELWRGGHHLQHRGEAGRMRRLDSTPESIRPQAAPWWHSSVGSTYPKFGSHSSADRCSLVCPKLF